MSELFWHVYSVDSPEGPRDYVALLPADQAFSRGLVPQAIVGVLSRPLAVGESITPDLFIRNREFVQFLHDVIARRGPGLPSLVAQATSQRDGWVYLIDERTPTPNGSVPPEDIIGAFEVSGGRLVTGSYRASSRFRILSSDGFFKLFAELRAVLLEELAGLS